MKEINIRKLYSNILVPLTPSRQIRKVIDVTMTGSADALDYIHALGDDPFFQDYLLKAANAMAVDSKIAGLAHAVALIGVNNVRNTVLGISMLKQIDSDSPLPEEFSDAVQLVQHAQKAEEIALAMKSKYPEIAFSGGFLFDLILAKIKSYTLKNLDNKELVEPAVFLEEVWKDGLYTAIVAEKLGSHFKLMHNKYIFATALVHNIGKLVLYAYDPIQYDNIVSNMKQNNIPYRQAEYEEILFSHASLGSLFLKRIGYLELVEKAVDFHHDMQLLKHDDPNLYELACVISISSNLVEFLVHGGKIDEFPYDTISEQMEVTKCNQDTIYKVMEFAKAQKPY